MTIDVGLALHCLSDLGSVNSPSCPIIAERTLVMAPQEACEGLSIRDTIVSFLGQAIEQEYSIRSSGGSNKKLHRVLGQQEALAYCAALMDNPYRPDSDSVRAEALSNLRARVSE